MPLDFKAESGTVYWKERGADTWTPFKSGVTIIEEISKKLYKSEKKTNTELNRSIGGTSTHDYTCGLVINKSEKPSGVIKTIIEENGSTYLLSSVIINLKTSIFRNRAADVATATTSINVYSYDSESGTTYDSLLTKSVSNGSNSNHSINLFGSNLSDSADSIYYSASLYAYATEGDHHTDCIATANSGITISSEYIKLS